MKNYWLYPFSHNVWERFRKSQEKIIKVDYRRIIIAKKKIKQGDCFICFLTGISRFIATLEVVNESSINDINGLNKIEENDFYKEIKTNILYSLTPDTSLSVRNFFNQISIFENNKSINTWTNFVKEPPVYINETDGRTISEAIKHAATNTDKSIDERIK